MSFQTFLEDLKQLLEKGDYESFRCALLANSHQLNQKHPYCNESNCTRFKRPEECNPDNKEIIKLIDNYPKFLRPIKTSIDLRKYFKRAIIRGDLQSANALMLIEKSTFGNVFSDMYQAKTILLKLIDLAEPEDQDIVEIAKIFSDLGALDIGTPFWRSIPLCSAVLILNVSLVRYFLDRGLPVNVDEVCSTVLQHAIPYFNGDLTILDMLMAHGADVNRAEEFGETALHYACRINNQTLIRYFMRKGADVNLRDDSVFPGLTPLDLLDERAYNYDWIVRIIVKEFAKLTFGQDEPNLEFMREKPNARKIFDECLAELKAMAGTEFYVSHTFYSVINGSLEVKKLAALTRNEKLAEKFLSHSREFDYYREDLRDVWDEAVRAWYNLKVAEYRLRLIFGHLFPDVVVRKLTKNLTLEDLPVS